MSFEKMGIDRSHVQRAIEWTKSLLELPTGRAPSQNTYLLCPVERTLWDLKIVVDRVLEGVPVGVKPREWVTQTFEGDLMQLGFDILKFDDRRQRELGVLGCDLSELQSAHIVKWANGAEERNAFAAPAEPKVDQDQPMRVSTATTRFVRNSEFVRLVKSRANGTCECCGGRTFQNSFGEWFLEVHHKTWLSEGGRDEPSNMIALCPNCHRREHFGLDRMYGLQSDLDDCQSADSEPID